MNGRPRMRPTDRRGFRRPLVRTTRRLVGRAAAAVGTIALVACSNPAWIEDPEGVDAIVRPTGVTIRNNRAAEIGFRVIDASTAARVLMTPPCAQPGCPSVLPGTHKSVPKSEIFVWGESDRLSVAWWPIVPEPPDGFEMDSVRVISLRY